MSQDDAGPRPSQVTIAGWVVAVASVMLVVSVFDTLGRLHSIDMRAELTKIVTTGTGKDLGISVDTATSIVRWCLMVAAVAAATTGILGIFVLQRHVAARVALTVAAVPVVLTAPFSGGVLGALVGAGTAMLWTRPARDWFAGRRPVVAERAPVRYVAPPRPEPDAERPRAEVTPPSMPPSPPPASPAPTPGWGRPPAAYPGPVTGPVAPFGHPMMAPPYEQMPTQVRAACVLTWLFTAVTAAGSFLVVVAAVADRAQLRRMIHDNANLASYDESTVVTAMVAGCVLFVVWCLASAVLAYFVWRRQSWAWVMLLVSVAVAALVCLLAFPFSIVNLAASATTLGMLLSAPTRAWFRSRPQPPTPASLPPASQHLPEPPPDGKPPVW